MLISFFELRVLKELTDLKLNCQHGGAYDDPITGKSREFDIRALMYGDEFLRVHLSVELAPGRDSKHTSRVMSTIR